MKEPSDAPVNSHFCSERENSIYFLTVIYTCAFFPAVSFEMKACV